MKRFVLISILISNVIWADNTLVKITPDTPEIKINHHGTTVVIKRIQDTGHKLTDDFTKTSRPCPPHCIQRIEPVKGVKTIGERELIEFIKNKVYTKKGILVDARLKEVYELETIPGAINIPYTLTSVNSKKIIDKLFTILGAKKKADGSFDFTNAKDIAVFCGGLWCNASVEFVKNMVKKGYPKNKLYYYRDGMQGWKLLGLTTVVHKAIEAGKDR